MTTAVERLGRLLDLLPRVAGGDWHSLDALRREYDDDVDELVAELRALAAGSEDVAGFVDAVQIYLRGDAVAVQTSHFLRPMRLTPREAAALELGLAMLAAERPPEEWPTIERVRDRLRSALTMQVPTALREEMPSALYMSAAPVPVADSDILAMLRRAVRDRRVVSIEYRSHAGPAPASRQVHPYVVREVRGGWYLWAFDEKSAERRLFRVDRIEHARQLDDRFERPADVGEHEFMREGRAFHGAAPQSLRVKYSDTIARWIAEREVHETVPGGIVVEYPLGDPAWAVRHVLQYGPDAEVLEPEEIREEVQRTLARLVGDAGAPTPVPTPPRTAPRPPARTRGDR